MIDCASGEAALDLLSRRTFEMVFLDVMLGPPGSLDGLQLCQRLKQRGAQRAGLRTVVVMVTGLDGATDRVRGSLAGCDAYLTKPLRPAVVLARVHTHLELKSARDRLRRDNAALEAEIARRLHENQVVQEVTIRALARLAETRDNETGNHILRTQEYVETLARRACRHPRFAEALDEHAIALIAKSAPLHDIGKVGIPDPVLLKPGKLTPEEWEVMKTHARLGADAIARAVADTHQPVEFLAYAHQIALHHHERWDGSGYPDGLVGEAIPLSARLMAVADVFDALISARPYKPPMPLEKALQIIRDGSGNHFDPAVVQALEACLPEFERIARTWADAEVPA